MENGMAGTIGCIASSGKAGSSKGPLRNSPLIVPAENDAHSLQFQNVARALSAHRFNSILIPKVQPTLRGIECMGIPRVLVPERGINPTLSSNGMAPDRVDLGKDRNTEVGWRGKSGPHPSQPGSDDENVMMYHAQ